MTVNWAIRLGTAAVAITVLSVGSAWAREDEIEPVRGATSAGCYREIRYGYWCVRHHRLPIPWHYPER